MNPSLLTIAGLTGLVALSACGDANQPSSSSASAAAAAKSSAPASKSSAPPASATANPTAAASAAAAPGEPKTLGSGEDLMKLLKLPEGSSAQKVPAMEGFTFSAPKDVKLTSVGGTDRNKKWGTVSFGGQSMAALLANHEQDEGEKCMKMADVKGKLQGAKIVRDESWSVPVAEKGGKNTDYGETIELLVFERDGKQGFWAHKEFNHGDDSTHICCTAGSAADAKELKGSAEPAQVDAQAAVCLSMTFEF